MIRTVVGMRTTAADAAAGGPQAAPGRCTSAKGPAGLGPVQVLRHTGLAEWQWRVGTKAGLIPAADAGGHWSTAAADEVAGRREQIVAVVGVDAPVGGHNAAERLAERTGLEVCKEDVEALAEAGLLTAAGEYKGWPLWDCRALDGIGVDQLGPIVAERQAWEAASVSRWDAPAYLCLRREEFMRVAEQRGLRPGRMDRYATADLDALAADEDLAEQIRLDRLLIGRQAADHLEIRPTDFRYLVAADLAVPHRYTWTQVSRWREVSVPLYRVGDLEALRDHPDIDWEAVRAIRAGEPSPLRHLARRPVDRAAVVRRWVAELGDRHGIETWAWWHPGAGRWEIDFERIAGGPTPADVRVELADHPLLRDAAAAGHLKVATRAGAALRWARALREPGAAVILDTETTDLDGVLVEVAVLDACTGEVLLDTLIRPDAPISPAATWVHGIRDADVADAPPLAEVLPLLLEVTAGRTVIAYNAPFDAARITQHAHRDGLDPAHLGRTEIWACLMQRRTEWALRRRWLPLCGGHRARGDCQTAYELLCAMTGPMAATGSIQPW